MPRTVIIRKTWRCPVCPHPGSAQWDNDSLNGKLCPLCGVGIVRLETDPEKCGTLTVMGSEDIEDEIADRTESIHRVRRVASVSRITKTLNEFGDEVTTQTAVPFANATPDEQRYAVARMERDIAQLKAQNYFLVTPTDVVSYRTKRLADIASAILTNQARAL